MMFPTTALLFLSALVIGQLSASALHEHGRREAVVLPSSRGPCPQDRGQSPPICDVVESICVDQPASGICHIASRDGFPICGCCETEPVACEACGGDAGGGICKGTGIRNIAYSGCNCSTTAGIEFSQEDDANTTTNVCPEDDGGTAMSCDAAACGGDAFKQGLCSSRTPVSGAFYRYCSCCPANETLTCDECGGASGNGTCTGIPIYYGTQYRNCPCQDVNNTSPETDNGTTQVPLVIPVPIPFPIPVGFPIPPPITPEPEAPCPEAITTRCSDCNGVDGWCLDTGCPCKKECTIDGDAPKCRSESCMGESGGTCTVGPQQDCECDQEEQDCPAGFFNLPSCQDADDCGGPTDDTAFSTCSGGNLVNCTCIQGEFSATPNLGYSDADIQQAITALTNAGISVDGNATTNSTTNSTTTSTITSTYSSTSTSASSSTTTSHPTGPTGFHVVALKCDEHCSDALEIVPSANDSCQTISENQPAWWGAAYPHPAMDATQKAQDQIPPFSLLQDSSSFDVLYVFDDHGFAAELCGLQMLNFTFTKTSSGWNWSNTDNASGTCYDNTQAPPGSCNVNSKTYTAQEELVCVDPSNPGYCAQVII